LHWGSVLLKIALGQRITELMKQPQYSPLTVALLATSLFAANEGYLDDIEPAKVRDFEDALHAYMNANQTDLLKMIDDTGDYNDDIESRLRAALDDFKANHTW